MRQPAAAVAGEPAGAGPSEDDEGEQQHCVETDSRHGSDGNADLPSHEDVPDHHSQNGFVTASKAVLADEAAPSSLAEKAMPSSHAEEAPGHYDGSDLSSMKVRVHPLLSMAGEGFMMSNALMYLHAQVPDLRELCKKKNVTGYSKMRKQELIEALQELEPSA